MIEMMNTVRPCTNCVKLQEVRTKSSGPWLPHIHDHPCAAIQVYFDEPAELITIACENVAGGDLMEACHGPATPTVESVS